ncbi:hypothetical protein D3C86_1409490 [compost metagenome]
MATATISVTTASSGIATRARRVTPSPKTIASTATSALAAASTPSVCTTPIHGTSTTPASTDPAMPPSVLSASTAPSPAPTRAGSTDSRTAYGNAAPSSTVGTKTMHSAATVKRALEAASRLPVPSSTRA